MFKLVVNPGTNQSWEIPLPPGVTVLGNGPEVAFPIAHETVSPAHCEVTVHDGRVVLKDLDSRYGTFVNREPVTQAVLAPGQAFHLGDVQFRLVSEASLPEEGTAGALRPAPVQEPWAEAESIPVLRDVYCKYHPQSPATWTCRSCRVYFCDVCVATRPSGNRPARFCRRCGSECAPVRIETGRQERPTFLKSLPGVFAYPFKGNGPILLVGGALVFFLMGSIGSLGVIGPYAGVLMLLAGVCLAGYVFNYAKRIITSTVEGAVAPPDWPDFSDWREDMLAPFLQLLALLVLTFGPASVLRWWHPLGDAHAGAIVFAATALGCLLAPMGALALAMFDSVGALNPIALLWSILRIPLPYLLAAVAFELVLGAHWVVGHLFDYLRPVPVLPRLLLGFINLYLLTAGMRILGLLYLSHEHRLGWFSRERD